VGLLALPPGPVERGSSSGFANAEVWVISDGDLETLTIAEKTTLVDAVKAVRDLPDVALRSSSLSGLDDEHLRGCL
jgi:hypothetical protein